MTTVLKASLAVYASARHRSLSNISDLFQFVTEHKEIIEAIARQDPDLAAALMTKHIENSQNRIEGEVE